MKAIIKINRALSDGHKQELGEFPFFDGDYFNLYHNVVTDSGLANSPLAPWFGFKIKIGGKDVLIKKLLPVESETRVGVGGELALDFQGLGEYELRIASISSKRPVAK